MTSHQKRWLGIAALVPTIALAFMDQAILPVALPTIGLEFGASNIALQWCVNAYLLAISVLVLASGKFSDRIGHRRALSFGMLLFTFSSALCGLSPNVEFLIGARVLQGLGAAMMFPAQSVLIASIFPPDKRGSATGIIVSIGAIFLIVAPLIGGYLTAVLSWRWIFWINLPIAVLGLWMIQRFLPFIEPGKQKIDLPGFLFFAVFATFWTLLFMQAEDWGWSSIKIGACGFFALLGLFLLILREKKTAHPFLDLTLFKRPQYAAISLSVSIAQFILMITVFRTIYFQEVLQYDPFQTGLLTFASCIPIFFTPTLAGFLSDRLTHKVPVAIGYLFLIFSCLYFGFFTTPPLFHLVIALAIFSMGIPLILTPSYSTAMTEIPPSKLGIGFGMLITLRMFSAAVGLALINLFVSAVQKTHRLTEGIRLAQITSFSWIHFALAFLLIVAFAIAFILHTRKSPREIA